MKLINRIVLGILAMILISGCSQTEEKSITVQKIAVEVEPITRGDITVTKTYSGTLEGARQSKVWAAISDRVVSIPTSEGNFVKAGEPIVILDKGGAASQYNQTRAVYMNAEDNYDKMSNLYEQRAISEYDYKSARTQYEVAKANFQAAKAAVELSVPIDGIVTDIAVNVGDRAPMGIPIATVANTKRMRLTVYVITDVMEKLEVGQKAQVFIDSSKPIEAKIIEVSKSADPETRLFRVELEMDNTGGTLKPGMFAKAKVVIQELVDVPVISRRAVFTEEGIPKAYLIKNDSAFVQTVEIGATNGEIFQLLSGLEQGQQVVVVGKSALRNKAPVIIADNEE